MKYIAHIIIQLLKIIYLYIDKSKYLSNEINEKLSTKSNNVKSVIKIENETKIYMPKQSDFKNEALRNWGCYFFCLLFLASLIRAAKLKISQSLSISQIELMFKGLDNKNINKLNAFVKNPNGILKELGVLNDIKFSDAFINPHDMNFYTHSTLFVARYIYKNYNHFVVVDKDKTLLFDSLGNSLVRTKGEISNLRPFTLQDDKLNFEILKLLSGGEIYESINCG